MYIYNYLNNNNIKLEMIICPIKEAKRNRHFE